MFDFLSFVWDFALYPVFNISQDNLFLFVIFLFFVFEGVCFLFGYLFRRF